MVLTENLTKENDSLNEMENLVVHKGIKMNRVSLDEVGNEAINKDIQISKDNESLNEGGNEYNEEDVLLKIDDSNKAENLVMNEDVQTINKSHEVPTHNESLNKVWDECNEEDLLLTCEQASSDKDWCYVENNIGNNVENNEAKRDSHCDIEISSTRTLLNGIGRLSSKIKAKAIEIDDEYQIVDNAKQSKVGSFVISTGLKASSLYEEHDVSSKVKMASRDTSEKFRNFDENYGVSQKVVGATKTASEEIRNLDEKYGIADKLVGAALAIGSIQMASGKFKGGATTLAAATIFAAMTERRKGKKQADDHELHLS